MITTNQLIEWIKKKADPTLNVVEQDYASGCIQRLREYEEVRLALMKIVEGLEELEAIYLDRNQNE